MESTEPGRWILQPKHQRRVILTARRCGSLDEKGKLNSGDLICLKRTRSEAVKAGHDIEEVNKWTMQALIDGRSFGS